MKRDAWAIVLVSALFAPAASAADLPAALVTPYLDVQVKLAGDQFSGWDCSTNFDWMPNQSLTVRLEYVHREASVPYFAGHGGVTSPTGYTTTPIPAGWAPDLVKTEDRVIFAVLFRL